MTQYQFQLNKKNRKINNNQHYRKLNQNQEHPNKAQHYQKLNNLKVSQKIINFLMFNQLSK